DRPVRGPVVDHEPVDGVEALDRAREVREGGGQLTLLVEAGNLDDQLHEAAQGYSADQTRRGPRGRVPQGCAPRRARLSGSAAPTLRPGRLVGLVLEPSDLAVLHLGDVLEHGAELLPALV